MATVKKSMKSAPRTMKPVAPARKGAKPAPMMQSPMSAAPIMKKGGKMKKAQSGESVSDYVKKSLKTVDSLRGANPKLGPKGLKGLINETMANKAKADSIEKAVEKRVGVPRKLNMYEQKFGGKTKKYKSGGSFPDLNKDGKVTRADILKGRGVIAKKGASVSKKCKYGCK